MVAGVLMNFILAIIIYAGIAWYWGEKYIEYRDAKGRHGVCTVGKGNRIPRRRHTLLADGEEMYASDPSSLLKMVEAKTVTVLRDGRDSVEIAIPENFIFPRQ